MDLLLSWPYPLHHCTNNTLVAELRPQTKHSAEMIMKSPEQNDLKFYIYITRIHFADDQPDRTNIEDIPHRGSGSFITFMLSKHML